MSLRGVFNTFREARNKNLTWEPFYYSPLWDKYYIISEECFNNKKGNNIL